MHLKILESNIGSPILGTTRNCKRLIFNRLQFLLSARVNAVSTDPTASPRPNRNGRPYRDLNKPNLNSSTLFNSTAQYHVGLYNRIPSALCRRHKKECNILSL